MVKSYESYSAKSERNRKETGKESENDYRKETYWSKEPYRLTITSIGGLQATEGAAGGVYASHSF